MLQAAKLKGWGHLSPMTLNIQVQGLIFALLDFDLALL